jgi:hypothetical protein
MGEFARRARNGQQSGRSSLLAMNKDVPIPYCPFYRPFTCQISAHEIKRFTIQRHTDPGRMFCEQRMERISLASRRGTDVLVITTQRGYREDRFHTPRCGRTPGGLHGPVPMSQWAHRPVGTSCPRVGIGVTRPQRCPLLSFFVVFLGGESGTGGV